MKKGNAFTKFIYSQKAAPYVFVLPFILSFCIFWIYPLSSTILMSFQDIKPSGTVWVGLDNYLKLMKDKVFLQAVGNSTLYMVLTLVLLIPFPMAFAVLMDSNFVKAKGIWKAILYVPALTSVVISGTLFRLMFSEQPTALANQIIGFFGNSPIKWLKMYPTSYFALLLIACWRWTGVNMLYFLAGLKNIDSGMYEAADIDGANSWQRIRYITIPSLIPTMMILVLLAIGNIFRGDFGLFYQTVKSSALLQPATEIIDTYVFKLLINDGNIGVSAAVGLYQSVLCFITINLANWLVKRVQPDYALY